MGEYDMTINKLIKQLTFQNVQEMFSNYCTLKPDHILLHDLEQILQEESIRSVANVRGFYNRAILKYYPNETTIKAAFLKQMLFKKRRDITIFELPVGGSRADLCKINGSSIAYEIKTDLDNLKRLNKQITDYQRVFEQVYVICSLKRVSEIENMLPYYCGIYTYTSLPRKQYHFEKYRTAKMNTIFDSKQQLSLLWSSELRYVFPNLKHLCKTDAIEYILTGYTNDEINDIFKTMLMKRFESQWSFLLDNRRNIYEIDYQWFYQHKVSPQLVYGL